MISRDQIATMFADFIERNADIGTAIQIYEETMFDQRFAAKNPARQYWVRPVNRVEAEYIRLKGFELEGSGEPYICAKRMPDGNIAHFPHRFPLKPNHAAEFDDFLALRCFQTAARGFVK